MYYKVIILGNETGDHEEWINACKKRVDIVYHVVDITNPHWLEDILNYDCDFLLTKPSGMTSLYKTLYDERLSILVNELNYKCYPSFKEVLIYENKRYLHYYLKANNIPHPKTIIFYSKDDALKAAENMVYPIVGKMNIGSSGKGINILEDKKEAIKYITKVFKEGLKLAYGPKIKKGNIIYRIWRKITHINELKNRLNTYRQLSHETQKGYIMFQEFIPHDFEWRVVRIGNSFFAHKKLVKNGKASGTLLKKYEDPPISLLDFVKGITDRANFFSQAVDIFEIAKDTYFVNEMQCIFGQSDSYQMLVDNVPGRYLYLDNRWQFEPGDFNTNQSYDLRLNYVIENLIS